MKLKFGVLTLAPDHSIFLHDLIAQAKVLEHPIDLGSELVAALGFKFGYHASL